MRSLCTLSPLFALVAFTAHPLAADAPRSVDPRLTVELFATHPEIVTPTGLAVDSQGQVFVAESHTHFRPDDYDGPPADRILVFSDQNGDGKAEPPRVFHEGFVHVMDIEFHRDGSLYVATRRDIHRLRDTDQDGRADEITQLVRLETKGNYPHNGLSGIAFHPAGGFHFGLGENLGESYILIGSDGAQVSGGGEGGSTYHVGDDGSGLRRVSTGWWNPYGMCTDSLGRVFGTDNDPDSSPPCRLIQVVDNANYGYEFRYGRSGRNPLITWDGELPGTLPMISGTGEAPCHIVAYESDAFPPEYVGNLLIPSWADHRVERYQLTQRSDRGLIETRREALIEGPEDFRPVGIDVAPDGSVYISDWVSSSYTLHKQGRIWRIRPQQQPERRGNAPASERLLARDRRIREQAAAELLAAGDGNAALDAAARSAELIQARATAMIATRSYAAAFDDQAPLELRMLAVQFLSGHPRQLNQASLPVPVLAASLHYVTPPEDQLASFLQHPDPWVQQAATWMLARQLSADPERIERWVNEVGQLPALLALRHINSLEPPAVRRLLSASLQSATATARLAAVKWIADERLIDFRPELERALANETLDMRTFLGIHVALDRVDGQPIKDRPAADRLAARAFDDRTPVAIRTRCLRLLDPQAAKLPIERIEPLLSHEDDDLRAEAMRAIARHTSERRFEIARSVARDPQQPAIMRAHAIATLATQAESHLSDLLAFMSDPDSLVREETLRALVGVPLSERQQHAVRALAQRHPESAEGVERLLQEKPTERPAASDTANWQKLLTKKGDAAAGERVFFGVKVGRCSGCHQVEGLGAAVGPDLTTMSRRVQAAGPEGRTWLLETILQPSRDMAPQFTPWQIVTTDGRQHLGLPLRKGGTSEAYLGSDGREFTLKKQDIETRHEASISIMPEGLLQQLTQQELADLFAFLSERQGASRR